MADSLLQFARGGAEFTVQLLDNLKTATSGKGNILISPLSIQACMALAFSGAKGETATEIARVMEYNSDSVKKVGEHFKKVLEKYENNKNLKMANKIYIKQGHSLKSEYAILTKQQFNAEAESLNFADNQAAAEVINGWVENRTAGKISNLIAADSLDDNTRMVLLNALHFKGEWQEKFDETQTRTGDFWMGPDECVEVQYMHQNTEFKFSYIADLACKALEMPYKDSDLSMIVLLPHEKNGLFELCENLKAFNLLDLCKQLKEVDIMIGFPKFKIDFSMELSDVLKEMGIAKAFSSEADFSDMLNSPEGLFISDVFHKASIEVNEVGAEASAATAMKIVPYCMPPRFIADHPFLYWIWDRENILFAGAFVKPPTSEK